jgi:hypothetical protein
MHKILLILFISVISFSVKAQDYSNWNLGYYYDLNNIKISGLISWNVPQRTPFKGKGDHIFYRISPDDKKQKISTEKFKSFVVLADSFVVSKDTIVKDYPVLKVVINNSSKLYLSLRVNNYYTAGPTVASISSGYDTRYFYGKDPDDITELDRSHFIEIMSGLMADDAKLVEAIKNKTYRYSKIDELLKQYKSSQQH